MSDTKIKIKTTTTNGTTYVLYSNGELWTCGAHRYRAGYVMGGAEAMDSAIDAHEEEMRIMWASAKAEFGF